MAAVAVLVAVSGGCARVCCPGGPAGGVEQGAPVGSLEAFEQEVPGSAESVRMAPIPAGTVVIEGPGGELLEARVGPIWMSAVEVTWDVYDAFALGLDEGMELPEGVDALTRPSRPYIPVDRGFGRAGYPAISMSFHGAEEFCRWLSAATGRAYRLPTEAEWEHACRAGGVCPTEDPWGVDAFAWHAGNSEGKTQPVGLKEPNAWGLHDMAGNVAEWCVGLDGRPVTRGGGYVHPVEGVGCGARLAPSWRWNESDPQEPKSQWWLADCSFVGFRIVRDPGQEEDPGDGD